MKAIGFITTALLGALLIYGAADFPAWLDPESPASMHVSPRYIEKSIKETHVPNMVTAVLADYRGFDTMFETIVIFTAGLACLVLLLPPGTIKSRSHLYRHIPTGITLRIEDGANLPDSEEFERIDSTWVPHHLIIRTTGRLLIPFIQVFALYVIAHGHYSPGGGFQGGVILGASVILFAIAFRLGSALLRIKKSTILLLTTAGVILYAATGLACMLLGGNFLDYSVLADIFGTDSVMARYHGIFLVEVGVGMSVMGAMAIIYGMLASAGRLEEGL